MEDHQIVDLYWERSERAITESKKKYEKLLLKISYSLLSSRPDSEECVNDTYLAAWNRMPTERPVFLGAFLSRIVRNLSIDRFRTLHASKRGSAIEQTVDELEECITDGMTVEIELESSMLRDIINRFVGGLDEEARVMFIKRYFFGESIADISKEMGVSQSKVKTSLFRRRAELAEILKKEGVL